MALADLLGHSGEIYSIDKNRSSLNEQERNIHKNFPSAAVHYLAADFTVPVDLPSLDGIVMANALHFHKNKAPIIELLKSYLKPEGRFILVEYNVDMGNPWVPYPLSFPAWAGLASSCGFKETRFLAAHPSRFLKEIYSALSKLTQIDPIFPSA